MKTFKLISLEIVEDDQTVSIPLDHGLIINKEDEHATWLIEVYTGLSMFDYFHKIYKEQRELILQVVITKKENYPAFFQTKISSMQKLGDHISVLLEGYMRRTNKRYSELLLENLLNQGLSGDELLQEFKAHRRAKPRIK